MKNVRQPLEILKETALVLCAQSQLARNAMELATSPTYLGVAPAAIEKIIRARLAVHNVSQEAADSFVRAYYEAKGK
jgi:hypothetical protein